MSSTHFKPKKLYLHAYFKYNILMEKPPKLTRKKKDDIKTTRATRRNREHARMPENLNKSRLLSQSREAFLPAIANQNELEQMKNTRLTREASNEAEWQKQLEAIKAKFEKEKRTKLPDEEKDR